MTIDLKTRVAIVTGAAQGIGRAIALALSEAGAKVAVVDYKKEAKAAELIKLIERGKGEAFYIECDVRKRPDADKAVEATVGRYKKVDILVNNAGIVRDGLLLAMSEADWRDVVETNLYGAFNFIQAVMQEMVFQKYGRIVSISSLSGEMGGVGQANYIASKGGINALTKAVASEMGSKNITVNAVAPGIVMTEMTNMVRHLTEDSLLKRIPLGRYAEPQDIANLVRFLVSEEASYITGQVVTIDGGYSLRGKN
ncbi:MAG: 3-oxoacyl-ACP reductase FabG [Candidatus Omnitrophica bacterium]|nr:3-oxoacyl-ACP reductase FabG [Candidatus Omnitrophota bacterium]